MPLNASYCYFCGSKAEIQGVDEQLVHCEGVCGSYLITRQARREIGVIPSTQAGLIFGRKEAILHRILKLREADALRRIRISRDLYAAFESAPDDTAPVSSPAASRA